MGESKWNHRVEPSVTPGRDLVLSRVRDHSAFVDAAILPRLMRGLLRWRAGAAFRLPLSTLRHLCCRIWTLLAPWQRWAASCRGTSCGLPVPGVRDRPVLSDQPQPCPGDGPLGPVMTPVEIDLLAQIGRSRRASRGPRCQDGRVQRRQQPAPASTQP